MFCSSRFKTGRVHWDVLPRTHVRPPELLWVNKQEFMLARLTLGQKGRKKVEIQSAIHLRYVIPAKFL